jgi:hypothetical protein
MYVNNHPRSELGEYPPNLVTLVAIIPSVSFCKVTIEKRQVKIFVLPCLDN